MRGKCLGNVRFLGRTCDAPVWSGGRGCREGREAGKGTDAEVSHASTELGTQAVLWTLPVPHAHDTLIFPARARRGKLGDIKQRNS